MQRKLIALAVASMTCAVAFADQPVSIHNHTAGVPKTGVPKMSKAQEKRTRRMLARHKGRK